MERRGETIARDVTEIGKDERMTLETEIPEVTLTEEEIAENLIRWKPYLAYIDDLISKIVIQAASSRFQTKD